MAFAGKWMKLENIMPSEISQSQKNQSTNYLTDKWMMTHRGRLEGGKNGVRRDCIEGKERWEGWGKVKNNGMNQTSLLYVNL